MRCVALFKVPMYYDIHTHHVADNTEGIVQIVNQYPKEWDRAISYYSVGIHPWYIDKQTLDDELAIMEARLQDAACLAVGECGLDKKAAVDFELQIKVFKKQLLLAEKYKKAVILHLVSSYQEAIEIKNELGLELPLIVHGFNKHWQLAKSLCERGFMLSFGGAVLGSDKLKEVILRIPSDKVFLETDDKRALQISTIYDEVRRFIPDIEQIVEQNFIRTFK